MKPAEFKTAMPSLQPANLPKIRHEVSRGRITIRAGHDVIAAISRDLEIVRIDYLGFRRPSYSSYLSYCRLQRGRHGMSRQETLFNSAAQAMGSVNPISHAPARPEDQLPQI